MMSARKKKATKKKAPTKKGGAMKKNKRASTKKVSRGKAKPAVAAVSKARGATRRSNAEIGAVTSPRRFG